jgi:CAAX prenyl protease-like protein
MTTPTPSPLESLTARWPALPWVAPFLVFMLLLAGLPALQVPEPWQGALRLLIPALVVLAVARQPLAGLRVTRPVASTLLGVAVFVLWVLPDQLVPGWRSHWLFSNALTGGTGAAAAAGSADAILQDPLQLVMRVARAALVVPVVEELFWRGWLPRWLVRSDWQGVPLGTFTRLAFLLSAALFASEHGSYWEVGLACGLVYNAWMARTRSLGDLILTHAVTNGALAAFVLATGQVAYWG